MPSIKSVQTEITPKSHKMICKSLLILVLILSVSFVLADNASDGQRTPSDRLIKEKTIEVPAELFDFVSADFKFTVVSGQTVVK